MFFKENIIENNEVPILKEFKEACRRFEANYLAALKYLLKDQIGIQPIAA